MANIKKYIGSKAFYRSVLAVAVPIMIQNGITNFVSLLDNIMVGRLGTEVMSGVSIVNQLLFVLQLLLFGAVSAAGIFTAQYHGTGNTDGVRYTFRFKIIVNLLTAAVGIAIFLCFGDGLISLFLHADGSGADTALTLAEGKKYLLAALFGLIPYALSQAYSSTLRETGSAMIPMVASIAAVVTNFCLNLILIFGLLGAPKLGAVGAAIATVTSRFVELAVLAVWTHKNKLRCPFAVGAFRSLYIPGHLVREITVKGMPLMLNEGLWVFGMTFRNQIYSGAGLTVVAAQNICLTVAEVFDIVYKSLGSAIAIILVNHLGADRIEEAKDANRKMIAFSMCCTVVISGLLIALSPLFPRIYNTTDEVRSLATFMIIITAAATPFAAFGYCSYFTLRSGGKILVTMLFDSIFMCFFVAPLAYLLMNIVGLEIHTAFIIVTFTDIIKALIGYLLLRRGDWANKLVE